MSTQKAAWSRFSRIFIPIFLFAATLGGCSTLRPGGTSAARQTVIWQLADQYVRIVPQDGKMPVAPNNQPVTLAPSKVRQMLGALEVKFPDRNQPVPAFSQPELNTLGKAISAGLAQAGPNQDVVFAIIGMHPGFISLERRLITGRVFFRKGKLNLIFGRLQAKYDDNADRRIHPFLPGTRLPGATPTWKILKIKGVEMVAQGGTTRRDWLTLDPAARKTWPVAETEHKVQPKQVSNAMKAAEAARAETKELRAQQQKLQEEVSGMRRAAAKQKATTTPQRGTLESIQARLKMLKKLRREHLITEKDYQKKKNQILNEL